MVGDTNESIAALKLLGAPSDKLTSTDQSIAMFPLEQTAETKALQKGAAAFVFRDTVFSVPSNPFPGFNPVLIPFGHFWTSDHTVFTTSADGLTDSNLAGDTTLVCRKAGVLDATLWVEMDDGAYPRYAAIGRQGFISPDLTLALTADNTRAVANPAYPDVVGALTATAAGMVATSVRSGLLQPFDMSMTVNNGDTVAHNVSYAALQVSWFPIADPGAFVY